MENAKSNGNSKLRGTETSTNSRIQYTPASSFQTHSSASSQNTVENTLMSNLVIGPHKTKSVGRGMAIQQMSKSIVTPTNFSKKTDLNFSNANIEIHFQNLKDKKKKVFNKHGTSKISVLVIH